MALDRSTRVEQPRADFNDDWHQRFRKLSPRSVRVIIVRKRARRRPVPKDPKGNFLILLAASYLGMSPYNALSPYNAPSPGIAAGPDFAGSGPNGIVYAVWVRRGEYLRPPDWRLSDEEELIILHHLSRGRIIRSYPGQSIPPRVGGQ